MLYFSLVAPARIVSHVLHLMYLCSWQINYNDVMIMMMVNQVK